MDVDPAVLFNFGVISDVQYADVEDGMNYTQTRTRHYRNALTLLREAVDHWTNAPARLRPDFVVQLGDIIDGCNAKGGKECSFQSLRRVLGEFDRLPCPVHHLLGNHEYYNFTRAELMASRLFSGAGFETAATSDPDCRCLPSSEEQGPGHSAKPPATYYHFSPFAGFRFVVLHSYERSIIGHDGAACPIHEDSLRRLRSVNTNELMNSPAGLVGPDRRFVAYNGAIGEAQREWLRGVLKGAASAKEKVVIFAHIPIYPTPRHLSCLVWDYQEVLNLLRSFPCVLAVMSGHVHNYLYTVDDVSGIHFLSLPGIVEIEPGSNGFGTVQVNADKLVLRGVGEVQSLEMPFPDKNPHLCGD